ncbi:unnamed protein product [marine sediment metagenome]|uniref:Uncharacterized protein n=1 Tax=marine sediment metagenome TaxID=412755 RepID=X0T3K0_9ZZZZ
MALVTLTEHRSSANPDGYTVQCSIETGTVKAIDDAGLINGKEPASLLTIVEDNGESRHRRVAGSVDHITHFIVQEHRQRGDSVEQDTAIALRLLCSIVDDRLHDFAVRIGDAITNSSGAITDSNDRTANAIDSLREQLTRDSCALILMVDDIGTRISHD